ncbi:MAG: hypothetical protein IPK04_00355 [Bdellovibrionales bacterium]|nr:hypothetical protein [Bdellovibrionales bacterium]
MYASNRLKMMSLSDNAIHIECNSKTRSFKKEHYYSAGGVTYSGRGAAISHGSSKKNALTAWYEDCKAQLTQQRKDNLEAAQRAIAHKVDALNSKNDTIVQLQEASALLIHNLKAHADELKDRKADLASELLDFEARLQKEAYDALDSKTKTEENIKKEITLEQKRQREKKTRLNSMGSKKPQTYGSKKDTTIADNFTDYHGAVGRLQEFNSVCCPLRGYVDLYDNDGVRFPDPPKGTPPRGDLIYERSPYCGKSTDIDALFEQANSISEGLSSDSS